MLTTSLGSDRAGTDMAFIPVLVTKHGIPQAKVWIRVYRYGTRDRLCAAQTRADGRTDLAVPYVGRVDIYAGSANNCVLSAYALADKAYDEWNIVL